MALGATQRQGLRRTTAEKELLRNISALEESYSSEGDFARKEALFSQLSELKGNLSGISGKTYANLMVENANLKKRLDDARGAIEKFRNSGSQTQLPNTPTSPESRIQKLMLTRYSQIINEREEKTVGDIKALVTKDDLTIQSLCETFKPEGYVFENHFFQAAEKAYNYVKDEIELVDFDINISFWLTPTEIVSEKIGDDEDQAVFLCSLLYCLGDESAECIIAELEDSTTHAFVMTSFEGNSAILDCAQKKPFREYIGAKKDILENYSYNGTRIKRFAYKFNHNNYEQFQG